MATIRYIPRNLDLSFVPTDGLDNIVSITSKALRLKIISDRYLRGFQKADVNGPPGSYKSERTSNVYENKSHIQLIEDKRKLGIRADSSSNGELKSSPSDYISEPVTNPSNTRKPDNDNTISIIDLDYDLNNGNRGYKAITLDFIPNELNYKPDSKFVAIATMGRNNPYYQFTGSEDTLSFDLEWFSIRKDQLDRKDVIEHCRWLESLTKGDSFNSTPPRVQLVWGKDNILWKNDIWVVVSAPYILTDFVKGYVLDGQTINVSLLPQQATQTITLKRLTTINRSTKDILSKL